MELHEFENILDNCTIKRVHDENGYPVSVIAFPSKSDAQKVWKFLHQLRLGMRQFSEFKNVTEH